MKHFFVKVADSPLLGVLFSPALVTYFGVLFIRQAYLKAMKYPNEKLAAQPDDMALLSSAASIIAASIVGLAFAVVGGIFLGLPAALALFVLGYCGTFWTFMGFFGFDEIKREIISFFRRSDSRPG